MSPLSAVLVVLVSAVMFRMKELGKVGLREVKFLYTY